MEKQSDRGGCPAGNLPFYAAGAAVCLGMKLFYSKAGSGALRWILAPTAGWVEILSGISFVYEPGAGYVNHSLRCLIAPSCAGVNYMVIVAAMLLFSFVHRMGAGQEADPGEKNARRSVFRRKCIWTAGCMLFSYPITVFVNGLRIVAAIFLPDLIQDPGIGRGVLSEERLHTAIGAAVYFVSLLAVYRIADTFVYRLENQKEEMQGSRRKSGRAAVLSPLLWYFGIALGLPFLRGVYGGGIEGYGAYAAPVVLVCGAVLAAWGLGRAAMGRRGQK